MFEAADATEAMVVLEKIVVDIVLSDVSVFQAEELAQWAREHELPTRFMRTAGQTIGSHPDGGTLDWLCRHPVSLDRGIPGWQQVEHSAVVLIAEDDVLLRTVTASSLRDAGFEILEAANAVEAVTVMNALSVDALISDLEIAGEMDGLALAKWVQAKGLNTKVVLTFSGEQTLRETHDHAFFLAKPYDDLLVRQILKKVLTQ